MTDTLDKMKIVAEEFSDPEEELEALKQIDEGI